ncbi:MAG: P-loop NTPase [Planctomycetota bacterium]|nr:P-loop NTPase [Planctomycetota bacterium]
MSDAFNDLEPNQGAQPNPLVMVHRMLRGRYIPLIVSAAILGGFGAVAGYFATDPLYASQGWIRMISRQDRVLYETPENQSIPMFDSFVRSQADLLRSRRVLDLAASQPKLREAGWPAPPIGVERLIGSLIVNAQRGSEFIQVSVTDRNPQLAQLATNAVLDAFMQYQEEQEGLNVTDRERRLRDNQSTLSSELKAIRESIIRVNEQVGGGDIEILLRSKTEELARLDSLLADPMIGLDTGRSSVFGSRSVTPAPLPGAGLTPASTPEQLSVLDPGLAELLGQRSSLQLRIDDLSRTLGPQHRELLSLRNTMSTLEAAIEARANELRAALAQQANAALEQAEKQQGEPGSSGATAPAANISPIDPERVRTQVRATRDQIATELRELKRAQLELKALSDRQRDSEARLQETNKALEIIRVENDIIKGGRVQIQQRGATPLRPSKDRRLPFAGAGLVGGAGFVFAAFLGVSFLQRRLRYADQLQSIDRMLPLIGVIPDVQSSRGGGREGGADNSSIVLALHHVRNSLLLLHAPGRRAPSAADVTPAAGALSASRGAVYLVTSSIQGEGKTTFSIALGASFAQAGYQTTLVDADLVGRGLSRELGMGQLPGLVESLDVGLQERHLHRTPIAGLRVMPAGRDDEEHAHRLRLENIGPVIEQLRRNADIVVVDTGPVLGSLEVGVLSQLSDVVVVIASRGTSERLINAGIDRVRKLSRTPVTLVFNRAYRDDTTTSTSYSSFRSRASDEDIARGRQGRSDRNRLARLLSAESTGVNGLNGVHARESGNASVGAPGGIAGGVPGGGGVSGGGSSSGGGVFGIDQGQGGSSRRFHGEGGKDE